MWANPFGERSPIETESQIGAIKRGVLIRCGKSRQAENAENKGESTSINQPSNLGGSTNSGVPDTLDEDAAQPEPRRPQRMEKDGWIDREAK